MAEGQTDLTSGPVARRLWSVSAPMSLGILGVLAVGLADALFLARAGDAELAAIGFIYPVIVTLSAFAIGISSGANAALSQGMGAGSSDRATARLALHALGFGAVVGLALAGSLWLVAGPLFSVLGAQGAVLEAILAYIPWWALSFPLLIATMILEATFRAGGDGVTPSFTMVLTAVLNIALTPALVFGVGPVAGLGMAGAGISTLVARAIAGAVALTLAMLRGNLAAGRRPADGLLASLRAITSVGMPAAGSRAINPAGMVIVTAAVATLGDAAVAGFGAAARVQSIALVPCLALASGLAPVIGQAWGADAQDRAREAVRLAGGFALAYGAGMGLALWALARPLAEAMTASSAAAHYTETYLQVVGWSLAGYGIVLAANAALTARSRATWALGLSLGRIGLFYIPLAWLGAALFGYGGILAAAVLSNIAGGWGGAVAVRLNGLLGRVPRTVPAPARKLATITGGSDA